MQSVVSQLRSGDRKFSAVETVVDVVVGIAIDKVVPIAKIPGITSGRNSKAAVTKSNATKLQNGTIKGISAKSAGKAVTAGAAGGGFQTLATHVSGEIKDQTIESVDMVKEETENVGN